MRFTTKFKLECVKKYQNGERIDLPAGWKYQTFRNRVRMWSRIYESLGEIGLEHKKPKRTWQDKMNMIQRVLNGESFSEVAYSNGIQESILSKWYKIYQDFKIFYIDCLVKNFVIC